MWRIKVSPINDAQEYRSILGDPQDEESLKNALSTYQKEMEISNAIIASAEVVTPGAGYNNPEINANSYTPTIVGFDGSGKSSITVNTTEYEASQGNTTGVPNGITFPSNPTQGDLFIRMDFNPQRLFVYRGNRWHRVMDNVSQGDWKTATLNASGYVNNTKLTSSNNAGSTKSPVDQRQPLSKVFTKPKADN